jgi:polyisoprenoid-binding protein YceI
MRRDFASVVAIAAILAALPFAADAKVSKGSGDASAGFDGWMTIGNQHFTGTTKDVSVSEVSKDNKNWVVVTVNLENLDAGVRTSHTKEKYLEVSKFKTAELRVDRATLKVPTEGADATGELTIHGQTKPVTFHYKATGPAKGPLVVTGSADINFTNFGISVPKYLGIGMKPDMKINASFNANDN